MSIVLEYDIISLNVRDEVSGNTVNKDAVVQVLWKITGTDEDLVAEDNKNQATFTGGTNFTTTNLPEDYNFVPFDQLTKEIVVSWVQNAIDSDPNYKQFIEAQLQEQISRNMRPITPAPLPWAPPLE